MSGILHSQEFLSSTLFNILLTYINTLVSIYILKYYVELCIINFFYVFPYQQVFKKFDHFT